MDDVYRIIKNTLLKELVEYFGADTKRIRHARRVLAFAEELLRHEHADWRIVIPASILHDVGIKAAEAKYGSSAGHYQEQEGPAIARRILRATTLTAGQIDEVCRIIGHHHSPGKINTLNFKVLYDADWLVNLKKRDCLRVFLTPTGRKIARARWAARRGTPGRARRR